MSDGVAEATYPELCHVQDDVLIERIYVGVSGSETAGNRVILTQDQLR
jgi:hypothetical protein